MTAGSAGGFGEVEGWLTVDSDDDPETRLNQENLDRLAQLDHRDRNIKVTPLKPREDDESQFWDLSHRHREAVSNVGRRVRLFIVVAAVLALLAAAAKGVSAFQEAVGI